MVKRVPTLSCSAYYLLEVIFVEKVKENNQKEDSGTRIDRRTYMGPFRVYEEGFLKGRAHLNLMDRGRVQLNMNVEVFSKGRYPYMFRKKNQEMAVTILIPLAAIEEIHNELVKKKLRVRRLETHKWIIRKFKSKKRC
jgi:hypothetical protein